MSGELSKEDRQEAHDQSLMIPRGYALGGLMTFNAEFGFIEAILRGLQSSFLTESDYNALVQCESLEDIKLALGDTDYKNCLASIQSELSIDLILERISQKTIKEFRWMRGQAVGQLSTFIEFITYEYLIENIQFVITGLIKGSQPETLITKCKPLGESPHLKSILTFENFESGDGLVELYRTVLVDTPVAKYFAQYFNKEMTNEQSKREFPREVQRHYDEQDIDIITNMLQKLWLEDFYYYCKGLGGDTAAVMTQLLSFEADKRAINITINSFRNSLNDDINRDTKRQELYCSFGHLYPVATLKEFVRVKNMDVLKEVLQPYQDYSTLWKNAVDAGSGGRADEEKGAGFYDAFQDQLFKHEVKLCKEAFERQCHFAGFYAFVKLKQQEERNLQWILNCINMGRGKEDRDRWVKTF